jgi:acetyl-CoA acetyltransferase
MIRNSEDANKYYQLVNQYVDDYIEEFIKKHNITPMARITGGAVHGLHPNIMGLGPVGAVKKLCERFHHKISEFDIIELNEAFAVQALGCIKELDLDVTKINMNNQLCRSDGGRLW